MLCLLLVFAALGSAVGITTPQDLAPDEANCNTCAFSAAPDQKITHDSACLVVGGMGCISVSASVSPERVFKMPAFNGCRYCETPGFEEISCETDTCMHSEMPTMEATTEPTIEDSEDDDDESTMEYSEDDEDEPTEDSDDDDKSTMDSDDDNEPTMEATLEPTPLEVAALEATPEPTLEPILEPTEGSRGDHDRSLLASTEEPTEEPSMEPTGETTPEGSEDELEVATGLDASPYIDEKATKGVIIDLLKLCLEPKEVTFVQIPFDKLQDAVGDKKNPHAILAPVQELALENPLKKPMHFSNVFFSAHNVAITHKGNPLKDFKDLAGKPVFSWDGAWKDLGPKFKAMYAPEKKEHKNLKQFEDQKEQVSEWKDSPDGVLMIGRAIFEVYAHELEISTEKLTMSKIFGDNTDFKAAFRDEKLRDSFNKNLEKICKDGAYEKVLEEYKLSAQGSLEEVCK